MPCVCRSHWQMSFFNVFFLFGPVSSLPDGSEGSVQPGSTLTNSTWGCLPKKSSLHTTASEPPQRTSLPLTNTHSVLHALYLIHGLSSLALIYTFTNRFRCHALQKPDVCWLLNKLTVYWETYRTHTHTLPCNKQQQKVILLVFASDNSGSQSKKCSEWLPTPVVKLTCTHNATPHVFGGQLWLVQ